MELRGRAAVSAVPRRMPWWVMAAIALQVSVPAGLLLFGDPPNRFGYQMYSAVGGFEVTVVDAQGRAVKIPGNTFAQERPEIAWPSHLPQYLCSRLDTAHIVTVTTSTGKQVAEC